MLRLTLTARPERYRGIFTMSMVSKKRWSGDEIDFLSKNYGRLSVLEISEKLNRSEDAIHWKANALNIKFVKNDYLELFKVIAQLNQKFTALESEVAALKDSIRSRKKFYRKQNLSQDDEKFIRENFKELSNADLSRKLQVSKSCVEIFLKNNKLRRTNSWYDCLEKYKRGERDRFVEQWARNTRSLCKKGLVEEDKVKLLKEAKFEFQSSTFKEKWNKTFEAIKNGSLGADVAFRWLSNQKKKYKLGELNDEQIKKLKSINFKFS